MIKETFFPSMPHDVFNMWLDPIVDKYGWPFSSITDSYEETKWKYVLGYNETLASWHSSKWELQKLKWGSIKLSFVEFCDISKLEVNAVLEEQTEIANIINTRDRFFACANFISKNRRFPAAVVLGDISDKALFNGHHLWDGAAGGRVKE
jgi:hypothetical protein